MSTELVLDFNADGTVTSLHMDSFDLGFLGKKHIERATEIRFDEDDQTWGLRLPGANWDSVGAGPQDRQWLWVQHGQGFDTYETARDFEVAWLNICRFRGEEPNSSWGSWALKALREIGKPASIDEFYNYVQP